MKMAFRHDFVWIIILYIAFPKYVIFCWFFLQKILSALEDPKIWFWLKKKKVQFIDFRLFASKRDHENQRPVIIM